MEKLIQKRRITTQEEYVQIVQYSDTKCSQKKWTFENFSSSTAAVYKDEISDLTLTSSVGRYFKFMFCPDYDPTVHDFYYNLLLKVHNSSQLQPTHNIFMSQYLLSPCNLYQSVLINAPKFYSMDTWNNISSRDQFEIK